ncbi:hypothetical protein [Desulfoluna spongiiphila]|uniref:hypothetical protein n=1 Tax=Desulfoluna spongiiphila TaxID=419481 RepID=UPI00125F4B22|nr:hypothetical protein [Desulfoluna spongiiphila]
MKGFSILINAILVIVLLCIAVDEGWPRHTEEQLMVCLFFLAPIFSIIALSQELKKKPSEKSENWLSLFLKRKQLEERAKINELKQKES